MRYIVKPTGRFVKDYKLVKKRGMKMALLEDVVAKLANGEALEKKHRDHELTGSFKGHRECHIHLMLKGKFQNIPKPLFPSTSGDFRRKWMHSRLLRKSIT